MIFNLCLFIIIIYSQAILQSKLDSAIPNACTGFSGYLELNKSKKKEGTVLRL